MHLQVDTYYIYAIRSMLTSQILYVGMTGNKLSRKRTHINTLLNNKHVNKGLQSHFNMFGSDDLVFHEIESHKDRSYSLKRELFNIFLFRPAYNSVMNLGHVTPFMPAPIEFLIPNTVSSK